MIITFLGTELSATPCCELNGLTLCDAESYAIERNYSLQQMRQLVLKAQAGRLEAVTKWFPRVELMSVGYKTERREVFSGTHSAFLTQVNISQAILSTERFYGVRIATLVQEQLCKLTEALKIDILFEVRTLFSQLLLDEQNLKTAKENLKVYEDLAKQQKSKVEIGTAIPLDYNQALVAVSNGWQRYYSALSAYKIHKDALIRAMGFEPGTVKLTLKGSPEIPEIQNKIALLGQNQELFSECEMQWWQAIALTYQPTLKVKRINVNIARQKALRARGEYFPEAGVEANYGGNPTNMLDNPSGSFGNQVFDWAIGYRVNWLLFDSFGREMRMREAYFETKAEKSSLQEQTLITIEDVRASIFSMEAAIATLVTATENVKLSLETVGLARKALEIGTITIFDLQRVIDEWILAQYARDEAHFILMRSFYALKHASGVDVAYE